ncbi:MAG: SAM-dependent methyltransferase [Vicinamibacterales bacterium]
MSRQIADVVSYYTHAGPDYRAWSRHFNMHFGYYRRGMNPFDLEAMLAQMNREVLERLELDPRAPQRILDMGCGLGTTARWAATAYDNLHVSGLTIVPWQVRQAASLTADHASRPRVRFVQGDFAAAPFSEESFDGIYALESSCYAAGYTKAALLKELHRLLKPGKRFVIADAFLKTQRKMSAPIRRCYQALCRCWSLDTLGDLHQVTACLATLGFRDVTVENISRHVTPSVLHIPLTTARFAVQQLLGRRSPLDPERRRHLLAGLLLIAFTIDRTRSGYFILSGSKSPR